MMKEEKNLLLKDLSARLPYGVKICYTDNSKINGHLVGIVGENVVMFSSGRADFPTSDVRPYLRPMSSMTDEEKKEFINLTDCDSITEVGFGYNEGGTLEDYVSSIPFKLLAIVIDWLNKHYFDYHGLIKMGLALEAHEGMYKI